MCTTLFYYNVLRVFNNNPHIKILTNSLNKGKIMFILNMFLSSLESYAENYLLVYLKFLNFLILDNILSENLLKTLCKHPHIDQQQCILTGNFQYYVLISINFLQSFLEILNSVMNSDYS